MIFGVSVTFYISTLLSVHPCDDGSNGGCVQICIKKYQFVQCACKVGFAYDKYKKDGGCKKVAVNGNWGKWTSFTKCDTECGGGTQIRTRTCDDPDPLNNGLACLMDGTNNKRSLTDRQIKTCNLQPCSGSSVVHGNWSVWTDWAKCDALCGGGAQIRTRSCTDPSPQRGGSICTTSLNKEKSLTEVQSKSCNTNPCLTPVHGNWSKWTDYGDCDKKCGSGQQIRTRTCDDPIPKDGGFLCSTGKFNDRALSETQSQVCNTQVCSNKPTVTRTTPKQLIEVVGKQASAFCSASGTADFKLTWQKYKPDTKLSPYVRFFEKSNFTGNVYYKQNILLFERLSEQDTGLFACVAENKAGKSSGVIQVIIRQVIKTKVNGDWGQWVDWQVCDKECGGGQQKRYRPCSSPPPSNGGMPCLLSDNTGNRGNVESETRRCNIQTCINVPQRICVDKRADCILYAKANYCTKRADYMSEYCCKTCKDEDKPAVPSTQKVGPPAVQQTASPTTQRTALPVTTQRTLAPKRKPSTIVTATPQTSCVDHRDDCMIYARASYCTKRADYMSKHCCKSCYDIGRPVIPQTHKTTAPAPPVTAQRASPAATNPAKKSPETTPPIAVVVVVPDCMDKRSDCIRYAKAGYCTKRAVYMLEYCCKTCKDVSKPAVPSTQKAGPPAVQQTAPLPTTQTAPPPPTQTTAPPTTQTTAPPTTQTTAPPTTRKPATKAPEPEPEPEPESCVDKNTGCSRYAEAGYCTLQPDLMIQHCCKTCTNYKPVLPQTQSPQMEPPTTQPPTTQPPTTHPPTTQPPTTQPPTTQPPATQPPTTQPPRTQGPAKETAPPTAPPKAVVEPETAEPTGSPTSPPIAVVVEPVNGAWGDWKNYSLCNKQCGGGQRERVRYCDSPRSENGGFDCLLSDNTGKRGEAEKEIKSCNTEPCTDVVVNGNWGSWGKYGECDKRCGGGQHERLRHCNSPSPQNGGFECLLSDNSGRRASTEKNRRECNLQVCPQPVEVKAKCSANVGFVLDSSGTLKRDFYSAKKFLKRLADSFGISGQGSRASVITFSYNAQHNIKFNDYHDSTSFNKAVDKLPLIDSTTRIDLALRLAQREMFEERNGAKRDIKKVLILLSDGAQTKRRGAEDPALISEELRRAGINILVVAIGGVINPRNLVRIAGHPGRVFYAKTFNELIRMNPIEEITQSTCYYVDPTVDCRSSLDISFLLESSGIDVTTFNAMKKLVKTLAATYGVSVEGSRAGVVTFSHDVRHSIRLNDHYKISVFNKAVDNLSLRGSTTMIDKALRFAEREVFAMENGARRGVPDLLVLITDNWQTKYDGAEDSARISKTLRDRGIQVIVVGVGNNIDATALTSIAGSRDRLFTVDNSNELQSTAFIQKILKTTCKPKPTQRTVKRVCEDDYDMCTSWKDMCRGYSNDWTAYMKRSCRRTCGYC